MDLSTARRTRLLSQWDIAVQLGVSQTKISLIERGYTEASEGEKKVIAEILGMHPGEINWPRRGEGFE